MTTTPTERRLAITKGTWQVDGSYPFHHLATVHGDGYGIRVGVQLDPDGDGEELDEENDDNEVEANAELIADAGTTYNTCHLTPSELLAKVREAKEWIDSYLHDYGWPSNKGANAKMREFIQSLPQ